MRQYTTPQQSARLIELGFARPKMAAPKLEWENGEPIFLPQYTIGELIEMMPPRTLSGGFDWDLNINHDYKFERWLCFFNPETQIGVATELVDALYNLITKLKGEGVI